MLREIEPAQCHTGGCPRASIVKQETRGKRIQFQTGCGGRVEGIKRETIGKKGQKVVQKHT